MARRVINLQKSSSVVFPIFCYSKYFVLHVYFDKWTSKFLSFPSLNVTDQEKEESTCIKFTYLLLFHEQTKLQNLLWKYTEYKKSCIVVTIL